MTTCEDWTNVYAVQPETDDTEYEELYELLSDYWFVEDGLCTHC